jgi:hypothetical protein
MLYRSIWFFQMQFGAKMFVFPVPNQSVDLVRVTTKRV